MLLFSCRRTTGVDDVTAPFGRAPYARAALLDQYLSLLLLGSTDETVHLYARLVTHRARLSGALDDCTDVRRDSADIAGIAQGYR
jgi:hypothetical protein